MKPSAIGTTLFVARRRRHAFGVGPSLNPG